MHSHIPNYQILTGKTPSKGTTLICKITCGNCVTTVTKITKLVLLISSVNM